MSFQAVLSDSEIGKMKAQLRAMERKRDEIAITIARTLNFPNIWTVEMIDWSNPEIAHFEDEFKDMDVNINRLAWEIAKAEAINDGSLDYHNAKVKAHAFMQKNFHSFDDEVEFFAKNGLVRGMSSLTEAIYRNPDFLNEVIK